MQPKKTGSELLFCLKSICFKSHIIHGREIKDVGLSNPQPKWHCVFSASIIKHDNNNLDMLLLEIIWLYLSLKSIEIVSYLLVKPLFPILPIFWTLKCFDFDHCETKKRVSTIWQLGSTSLYSCNKVRKIQNEHWNIICQNLNCL